MKEITKIAFDCGTLSKKRIVVVPETDKMFDEIFLSYFYGLTEYEIYVGTTENIIGADFFRTMFEAGQASAHLWKTKNQYVLKWYGIMGYLKKNYNLKSSSELRSISWEIACQVYDYPFRHAVYAVFDAISEIVVNQKYGLYEIVNLMTGRNTLLYHRAQCVFRLGFTIMMQNDKEK